MPPVPGAGPAENGDPVTWAKAPLEALMVNASMLPLRKSETYRNLLDGSTTIPSVWFGPDWFPNDVGTPELPKLKLEISFTAVAYRNDGLETGDGQLVQFSEIPICESPPKHPDIVNKNASVATIMELFITLLFLTNLIGFSFYSKSPARRLQHQPWPHGLKDGQSREYQSPRNRADDRHLISFHAA